ncbi:unnamed protein product, partial [Amoebophrya sp. A25]
LLHDAGRALIAAAADLPNTAETAQVRHLQETTDFFAVETNYCNRVGETWETVRPTQLRRTPLDSRSVTGTIPADRRVRVTRLSPVGTAGRICEVEDMTDPKIRGWVEVWAPSASSAGASAAAAQQQVMADREKADAIGLSQAGTSAGTEEPFGNNEEGSQDKNLWNPNAGDSHHKHWGIDVLTNP